MSVFKHQENKDSISKSITSLYETEHPVAVQQDQPQGNLSPIEHRELIKSQIAGSFNENTPTLSNEELEKSADDSLEKGGKRAVIGERRQFGGREYIKTAEGWKFHGKGTGAKATSHREGALDHHVETGKGAGEKKEISSNDTAREVSEKLDLDQKTSDKLRKIAEEGISDKEAYKKISKIIGDEKASKYMDWLGGEDYKEENTDEKYAKISAAADQKAAIDSLTSDQKKKLNDLSARMSQEKKQYAASKEASKSKHIGDMSATEMKAAADKLGIDVKGKSVKQVRKELTDANIDKQMADFKAKKGEDRGAKTITLETQFKEGDEVEIKENLYYVKKESGLISESKLEGEGYRKGGEGVSLYLKKGTKMKSIEDGKLDDIMFEGGGNETALDPSWIKDKEGK